MSLPLKPLLQESPRPLALTRQFKEALGIPGVQAQRAAKLEFVVASQLAHIDHVSVSPDDAGVDPLKKETEEGFQWGSALRQSLLFLAVQHGYAFTQPKTRRAIKGEFWNDYVDSVKGLHGWADGGRFFTNYIAHPMQGALTGFIQVQNDPGGRRLQFGKSKRYWRSRMKAMAWSAVFSTQFEIGPISQASIGNVGLYGKQTYVDLVVTPTVGTAWLIAEDALDRAVISWAERRTRNPFVRITARMILNPMRSGANLLAFKKPWHRDR
ncbi:MAG: hypothetical protein WKF30_17125 [Pyrinomonadaceae bacterium]